MSSDTNFLMTVAVTEEFLTRGFNSLQCMIMCFYVCTRIISLMLWAHFTKCKEGLG